MKTTELYKQFLQYRQSGDANIEGRCLSNICNALTLSDWNRFRLAYYYSTTYNIDSALKLLSNPRLTVEEISLRTDRRYARCNGAYPKIMSQLDLSMFENIRKVKTTKQAVQYVNTWYFFGRYATFLFLETYFSIFSPRWIDDVTFGWEPNENYTLGAKTLIFQQTNEALDSLLELLKSERTWRGNGISFSIETSLCGWWKILKGTRYYGFYTERLLNITGFIQNGYSTKLLKVNIET